MITADLDNELAAAQRALAARGVLPASSAQVSLAGTWRPGPDGDPSSYATAAPFEIAGPAGLHPARVAEAVAGALLSVPWIEAAMPSGDGYLTVTVTHQALAASAARMAAAGLACANSSILRGTAAHSRSWPDLAGASSWQHAWQLQADAMTSHLALAAGAAATALSGRERASTDTQPASTTRSPVHDAVEFFGSDSVRYRLARTTSGHQLHPAAIGIADSGTARTPMEDPLYPVQQAHAAAASALRWAADLGLGPAELTDGLGRQLSSPAERALLGLLSFLPVRVAAAARRRRPDELPRYLEQVGSAWLACRLQAPALPFGGRAAPRDPDEAGARLMLARAVAAVVAAGLGLTGVAAPGRL
ncbi:MAG TPA: DALR anticodon-binding domain-containing protein [Streptosporangiaceae bacterium]|nr:DALR anticodon-binding domain-containing protein [Streptosporangiaceae bacterium]